MLSSLAIITARGGSKGVPRKNIKSVGGKPLLAYTIEAAKSSELLNKTILSTDDEEIMAVAREWGCEVPFRRPDHLASDKASSMDVVFHAMEHFPESEYIVLLQPTSPLRTSADIDSCLTRCKAAGTSCVSVTAISESPSWMYKVDSCGQMHPFLKGHAPLARRQDQAPLYILNGAVYAASRDFLLRERSFVGTGTIAYEMPSDRSVDIDTELDLTFFETILKSKLDTK